MSASTGGIPPTLPRDLPGPSNSPQEWEAAFQTARRAVRDLWDATLTATRDAVLIVNYLGTERPERAGDPAMSGQRDRLTQCRTRFVEAFNCGRPANSLGEWPALSPSAVYDAAAETPPYVVSSAAFNYSALFEFATATLQIGWDARPGEGWGRLWPALGMHRESPAAQRLAAAERWQHLRIPPLTDADVVDAFTAAMAREAVKAEQELRRRVGAERHHPAPSLPVQPPAPEQTTTPSLEGRPAPFTLLRLENELRAIGRGEAESGPFCRSMDGSPVDMFSENYARVAYFLNLASQKHALEESEGYSELRTLVIRRMSPELTPDACRQLRGELVRADISAAAADRMTLPEIVSRLSIPPAQPPAKPRGVDQKGSETGAADSLAGLSESVRFAFGQYLEAERALQAGDASTTVTDHDAYEYLKSEERTLKKEETWTKYVRIGRKHLGASKRRRGIFESRSAAPPSHYGLRPD